MDARAVTGALTGAVNGAVNGARNQREGWIAGPAARDRIAADLNDHVLQELLATGLRLQGLVRGLTEDQHQAQLLGCTDALDALIHHIHRTTYLLGPGRLGPAGTDIKERIA